KVKANIVHDPNSNPTTAATINEPLKKATFNFRLKDMLFSSVPGNRSADFNITFADFLADQLVGVFCRRRLVVKGLRARLTVGAVAAEADDDVRSADVDLPELVAGSGDILESAFADGSRHGAISFHS